MHTKYIATMVLLALLSVLNGCVTISDINEAYFRLGRAWQLDNQKMEDEYRYRVIDASYLDAFIAARKVFIALDMPIQVSDLKKGIVIAENVAPKPLTKEEWLTIKEIETPRLKEIGGLFFYFQDDPKDFTITVKATLKPLDNGVLIILDYIMDSRMLRRHGIIPTPYCPPSAVAFGSAKFWKTLQDELQGMGKVSPRKRTDKDKRSGAYEI